MAATSSAPERSRRRKRAWATVARSSTPRYPAREARGTGPHRTRQRRAEAEAAPPRHRAAALAWVSVLWRASWAWSSAARFARDAALHGASDLSPSAASAVTTRRDERRAELN